MAGNRPNTAAKPSTAMGISQPNRARSMVREWEIQNVPAPLRPAPNHQPSTKAPRVRTRDRLSQSSPVNPGISRNTRCNGGKAPAARMPSPAARPRRRQPDKPPTME